MMGAPEAAAGGDPETPAPLVREGRLVRLRAHRPGNREAFQRWYADDEIARLLRHDQRPLTAVQSRNYFDTFILPLSARGLCYAIHDAATDRLIGTTALTDVVGRRGHGRRAMFRILIGEKAFWGQGYGTEATRLVMAEAFAGHGVDQVRLEVFRHNPRAIAAYRRVGFRQIGEHTEWVGRERQELHVVEMVLDRDRFSAGGGAPGSGAEDVRAAGSRPGPSPPARRTASRSALRRCRRRRNARRRRARRGRTAPAGARR